MKSKFISVFIIAVLCIGLMACSKPDTEETTIEESTTTKVYKETTTEKETTKVAKTKRSTKAEETTKEVETTIAETEEIVEGIETYNEIIEGTAEEYIGEPEYIEETAYIEEQVYSEYTPEDLLYNGVIYWGDYKYTYYSENVLPGDGLDIPGRWSDGNFVRDADGYICVASEDLDYGSLVDTPWGTAKVYDSGCDSGVCDVYVSW